jgi:hypothetical protein
MTSATLNDSKTLDQLRMRASKSRRPSDWHPVLDRILKALGISLVWTPVKSLRADKGTSGLAMFYQDRTIFISPDANKHYMPEWHEISHAIVGRDYADEPNWGNERLPVETTDALEFQAQKVQIYLMNRFLGDDKKARRAAKSFQADWESSLKEGKAILAQKLPELPDLVA